MTTMRKTNLFALLAGAGALALLAGCSSSGGGLTLGGDDTGGGGDDTGSGGGGTTAQACTEGGTTYVGFANTQLTADRPDGTVGGEHGRIKPFSALQGEYPRVIGATPATLAATGPTFGQPPARWYQEPEASAVSIFTAYSVAFDGCLTMTATDAKYAQAPDATSAAAACSSFARTFWSRTATPDEVKACVDVATTKTTAETDARRRWAYTCAAVMSSAGFLTY